MKKIALTILFIFIMNSGGFTQPGQQGGGWMAGGQNFIVQYSDVLELSDEQKKELIAITLEQRTERRFAQQENRGDRRPAVRGNRQNNRQGPGVRGSGLQRDNETRFEYRAEMHNRIREVLTEEQLVKLEALREDRINSVTELRTLRHEVMIEKAGLEGEKATRVKELLDNHAKNRPVNTGDFSRESANQYREVRQEEFTALHNELKQLLTAAEYENLQKYMSQGRASNWNRNRTPGSRNR